jgi:hypothetical protein
MDWPGSAASRMPCLLKEPTPGSPGIITFTHNEVLRGVAAKSLRVKKFLEVSTENRTWLFGVHIQGYISSSDAWPLEPWQSFIMWPDETASFLAGVPRDRILNCNCIQFMPTVSPRPIGMERNVDVCVISRASPIKRIFETLCILHGLMEAIPEFTATVVVADARRIEYGLECYEKQDVDRRYFELPMRIFSSAQLKRISFISSSDQAFGRFPLSNELMADLLHRSRFLLLTSHNEGTPRVIAEALMAEVPCIVSRHLESGIRIPLFSENTLLIDDDIPKAVAQIREGLANYHRFSVDGKKACEAFAADHHRGMLQASLSDRILSMGCEVQGRWFLDDLHLRLACHGQKRNYQYMDDDEQFFNWIEKVSGHRDSEGQLFDPYDEDAMFGDDEVFGQAETKIRPVGRIRGLLYDLRRQLAGGAI